MDKEQCSELFSVVFDSRCRNSVHTCECGITYFNDHEGWAYAEELKELHRKAKVNPDKYIRVDHSIGTMEISGISIVYGCSCALARKYEKFILQHGTQLAEYLNKYAALLRERANKIKVSF